MSKRLPFQQIAGSVTAPQGFRAAGVHCDIKRLGTGKGSNKGPKRDLALIVSEIPASAAGVYTTNKLRAAPVDWCIEITRTGTAQAIVANSGNANACTGPRGQRDTSAMARLTAKALNLPNEQILVCSTGRIGSYLPMKNVAAGIADAANRLAPDRAADVAEAIMTSDTRPKEIAVALQLDGREVRIGGVCKGAGMIQPHMTRDGLHATMLCFLTTDAAIRPAPLQRMLERAVAQSFNGISIDGDMSTNDTVLLLANGAAGNRPLTQPNESFQEALNFVTHELAKMIVLDGEGVSKLIHVQVHGAKSAAQADAAARAIVNSALVKTSWYGGDPNWGRVLCAVGYSRTDFAADAVEVAYRAVSGGPLRYAFRKGQPTNVPFATLLKIVAALEFEIHVFLHAGKHDARLMTADLTSDYVEFNKGDVSDPNSLGG